MYFKIIFLKNTTVSALMSFKKIILKLYIFKKNIYLISFYDMLALPLKMMDEKI